jgi:DMSO/TMAO reductase YedYZ molybdopterin-dependent catalytic subunit
MNNRDAGSRWALGQPPTFPLASVVGGGIAAIIAAGAMALLRATLQVRTIPERIMEWALLFVPLDVFEAGLHRFGFDAKRYALYAAIAAMLLVLTALGAVALERRWSSRAITALGTGLWLVTMVVIMPLTDAGFFASALVDGMRATIGGYLAVALLYAGTLALVSSIGQPTPRRATRGAAASGYATSRRSALLLVGGACAAYAATFVAALWGPNFRFTKVVVLDPQEPVPSGGIDPPGAHPHGTATRPEDVRSTASPVDLTEPPPARQLPRDKDGALLASGRRPGELSERITGNDDFYIVSKNAVSDPQLRAAEWRLVVDGEVGHTFQLDYASLRNLPAVEVTKTLECISNFTAKCELAPFGCDLISTARWKGVPLRDVLELTGGLKPGVVSLAVIGADEFTTALPIEVALAADTLLVYEMNGQLLPREHGYPARVLVPGRYGMKNAKWVVALRALGRDFLDWYGQRNWSRDAIVKTMTRIDVPAPNATLPPGEHRIAGVAYAGDRGVAKVEFSADGGENWQVAQFIEPAAGRDAWIRWEGRFTVAPSSQITLVARATDYTGALQIEAFSLPQPDGGSGWNSIEVHAQRV